MLFIGFLLDCEHLFETLQVDYMKAPLNTYPWLYLPTDIKKELEQHGNGFLQKLFTCSQHNNGEQLLQLCKSLFEVNYDFNQSLAASGFSLIHFLARDGLVKPLTFLADSTVSLNQKVQDITQRRDLSLNALSICLFSARKQLAENNSFATAGYHSCAQLLIDRCSVDRMEPRDMLFHNNTVLSFDGYLPLQIALELHYDDVALKMLEGHDCEHDRECLELAAKNGMASAYSFLVEKNYYENPPQIQLS